MIKRRRTEITVESQELFVVGSAGALVQAWCRVCEKPVRMISPEQATILTGMSTRSIYRMVEAGGVHYTETSGSRLLVCLSSLPKV
ncbi:MAG: hypothetical protein ND895_27530 [Pyrinomonadaceae bacterium]|nr:hypothetical protein [Pyrinomonadaceae bacterium]